jgi:hypothetical protein
MDGVEEKRLKVQRRGLKTNQRRHLRKALNYTRCSHFRLLQERHLEQLLNTADIINIQKILEKEKQVRTTENL